MLIVPAEALLAREMLAESGADESCAVQIMQVKNFGRRGRTKYTHLLDQDTTARDDYHGLDGIAGPRKGRRLAGTEQTFEKPKKLNT